MSEPAEEFIRAARNIVETAGNLAIEIDSLERHGAALTRDLVQARLVHALASLALSLAEARREDLAAVVARLKALEADKAEREERERRAALEEVVPRPPARKVIP